MKDVSQQHVMFSSVHTLEARFCWNRMSFSHLLLSFKTFIFSFLSALSLSVLLSFKTFYLPQPTSHGELYTTTAPINACFAPNETCHKSSILVNKKNGWNSLSSTQAQGFHLTTSLTYLSCPPDILTRPTYLTFCISP